jgi:UDP-glucose 4-epimerase
LGIIPKIEGTGVCDYIFVMGLTKGQIAALNHLTEVVHIYNLATDQGTSVLELVKAFEDRNGI